MGNCCKSASNVMSYMSCGSCNRAVFMENHYVNWSKVDEHTPELSFRGMRMMCKVVSVYDGDTIKVVFPLMGRLYKWNCRVDGVDTPELRTRCALEKEFGYFVRDKLREKILNKVIYIECGKFDKYGRLLITPYCKGVNVSEWLIKKGYAFQYGGGKKQSWSEYLMENGSVVRDMMVEGEVVDGEVDEREVDFEIVGEKMV